jgi:hypothetical protein
MGSRSSKGLDHRGKCYEGARYCERSDNRRHNEPLRGEMIDSNFKARHAVANVPHVYTGFG